MPEICPTAHPFAEVGPVVRDWLEPKKVSAPTTVNASGAAICNKLSVIISVHNQGRPCSWMNEETLIAHIFSRIVVGNIQALRIF